MRSISAKLTIAFLTVSLVGTVLAAVFIQQRTLLIFDRFLFDQDRSDLVSVLTQHYANTGSWEEVDQISVQLAPWRHPMGRNEMKEGVPKQRPATNYSTVTLVGSDGVIVFGPAEHIGHHASTKDIDNGVPIEVDGQVVGWLLTGKLPAPWGPESPAGVFMRSINSSIVFSALIAVFMALVLGAVLARTLTRPIRELTDATQVVAQGDLGYQVEVHSHDELGQLASSFNLMSADLEKSTQTRRQMTADIAHDLRTPLSVILGYTEALHDGKLEGTPEVYDVMHKEAGHLSRLIDDLRTLSLAETGELPLTLQPLPPVSILDRIAEAFKHQAERSSISLEVKADEALPLIQVDPDRMSQVLGNLVANALRYTPEGGVVQLGAELTPDGSVELWVRDNGTGIDPVELPHIFDRFYRGDKSRLHNGEAGLGLTIAKSLVEAQGGNIIVESSLGQGTCFSMRFSGRE
jgi:signal transduction histidine kinase